MKIDPANIVKLHETVSNKDMVPNKKSRQTGDRIEISDIGTKHSEIASMKSKIIYDVEKGASAEKLQRLKSEIENGTYHVSSDDIASAMLKKK